METRRRLLPRDRLDCQLPPLSGDQFRRQYGSVLSVSHETFKKLSAYLDLLNHWNKTHNLVGPATMKDPWRRHILDSAQIVRHLDCDNNRDFAQSLTLVDLGSGAGLPGLVLAILSEAVVHLIECNHKKCAFLTQAAAITNAQIIIHCHRIEDMKPIAADIITARALASLNSILGYAYHLSGSSARLIALKGKTWQDELADARTMWDCTVRTQSSISDPYGRLLDITDYHPSDMPSADTDNPSA